MMPWEFLIIPLIGFGVWLLSNIFRVAEEAQKNQRPPASPGEDRPRRGGTDLDRFLQEARQRRQTSERQRPETGEGLPIIRSPERPPEWTIGQPPAEVPRPAQRRQSERPPRDVPPRPGLELSRPRRTLSNVPLASPVPQPPLAKPVMLELAPDSPPAPSGKLAEPKVVTPGDLARAPAAAPPPPPAPPPQPAAAAQTVTSRGRGPSPVLQVARLLRSPQTAGTAVVLREILDRPLCRRRR